MDISRKNPEVRDLSNEELRTRLESISRTERRLTAAFIEHLAEAEKRGLHLDWGFTSVFEYLGRALGYSEASAFRRLQGARALMDLPELKEKIEDGTLKLSQIAEAQTSFRQEEKCTKDHIDLDQRRAIFRELEGKNTTETRKILVAELPTHVPFAKNTERFVHDESVQLNISVEKNTYRKLTRVRDLYGHKELRAPWPRVLDFMADDVIQKRDPRKKANVPLPEDPSTLKGKKLQAYIFQRDEFMCRHLHADGTICGSTVLVEIDHIVPKFAGGTDDPSNLRLLCRVHNQSRYKKGAGIKKV